MSQNKIKNLSKPLIEGNIRTNVKNNININIENSLPPPAPNNKLSELTKEIQDNIEWLQTTEENEVECIGIENLEGILTKYFGKPIKLSKNE